MLKNRCAALLMAVLPISATASGTEAFLPLPRTGWDFKRRALKEGAELFMKDFPGQKIILGEINYGDPAALAETLERELAAHRIVFGPADSSTALAMASHWHHRGDTLWGAVIASSRAHDLISTRSLFLPASLYLDGLPRHLRRLKVSPKNPIRFHRQAGVQYLEETELAARTALKKAGFTVLDPAAVGSGRKVDVYLTMDLPPATELESRGSPNAVRVFIYGNFREPALPEPVAPPSAPGETELHFVYWLPFLERSGASCAFSSRYKASSARYPDFHAAFLYASLEQALGGSKSSVVGRPKFDRRGQNLNSRPLVEEFGVDRASLWMPSGYRGACPPGMGAPLPSYRSKPFELRR